MTQLFTKDQKRKLLKNGRQSNDTEGAIDHFPIVKLFTPDANCTWLISEIDPDYPDNAFGLCDLGFECPEMGYVSITELTALRGRLGLPVERDRSFKAKHRLSTYADKARKAGAIRV